MSVENSGIAELNELISVDLHSTDVEAKAEFVKEFGNNIKEFSNATAIALSIWANFRDDLDDSDERRLTVAAIAFTAINQQLSSFKLFISGYTVASGGLFRQALEGVSLAVLCSAKTLTVLNRFMVDKYSTKNAVKDLIKHAQVLRIKTDVVRTMDDAYSFYHKYAHLTKLTIAAGANFSRDGAPNVGAYFDPGKIREYKKEVKGRVGFARILPNAITLVSQNVASW